MTRLLRCGLAIAATALVACGGSDEATGTSPDRVPDSATLPPDPATYFPDATWRTATPEQVGIPSSVLARVDQRVTSGTWRGIDSFIVIRRGYLVHETYYGASSRDDVHTMQSVSKSITSLVTGIASDAGSVDPDATVLSILPQYRDASPSGLPPRGPQQLERRLGADRSRSALQRRARHLLRALPSMSLRASVSLARSEASASTGSSRPTTPPFTRVAGFTCARSLARVGYLVSKQGQWNDRQIVSRDWVSRSTAPVTASASQFGGVSVDYGHLWWMAPISPAQSTADVNNRVIIAAGNRNQFLFVVPSRDLVVVNTGSSADSFGATVDFVVRELVPAVSR